MGPAVVLSDLILHRSLLSRAQIRNKSDRGHSRERAAGLSESQLVRPGRRGGRTNFGKIPRGARERCRGALPLRARRTGRKSSYSRRSVLIRSDCRPVGQPAGRYIHPFPLSGALRCARSPSRSRPSLLLSLSLDFARTQPLLRKYSSLILQYSDGRTDGRSDRPTSDVGQGEGR